MGKHETINKKNVLTLNYTCFSGVDYESNQQQVAQRRRTRQKKGDMEWATQPSIWEDRKRYQANIQ